MRHKQAVLIGLKRIARERHIVSSACIAWRRYVDVARQRTKVLELRSQLAEANSRHDELKSRHEEQGQGLLTTEEALRHWEKRIQVQEQWLVGLEEQLQGYEQCRPPPRPSQALPVDMASQTDWATAEESPSQNGELLASLSLSSGGFSVCLSPGDPQVSEAEEAPYWRQHVAALSQRLLERERRVVALKEALSQKMISPSMYRGLVRGCMGKENVAWEP